MGKRLDAERLVRRRLEEAPDDPLLWCALGDALGEDAPYLEVITKRNYVICNRDDVISKRD